MATIAFIPARSGSTRLKNKNILLINGKPLIYWTVKLAIQTKIFDKIIFSTDSKNYYRILLRNLKKDKIETKNLIFDQRNKIEAGKKKKIFDYIKYDLITKFEFSKNDLIVQMLPTCPLRRYKTITEAVQLAKNKNKNVFSVSEYDFHLSFAMSLNKNFWQPVFKDSPLVSGNTQGQNQKKYFHPNGVINCIFINKVNMNTKSIYEKAIPFVISKYEGLDIDTIEDFNTVKKLLK